MEYPLVSFISINYNQSGVTLDFLKSVYKITYPNFEIIIIDNASPSDNPDILKEKYPKIKLVKAKNNLGFAGGNNLGILKASGKYLLFINNDTEVKKDFLEPMVQAFENDSSLALASPKIIFHHSKEQRLMQYAGGTKINSITGNGTFIGYGEVDKNQYKTDYTELIHGAAVMTQMKLMQEISVWPDIYFLYYEEIDWSENFKRKGFKLKYIAESEVYHKESISIGKATPLRIFYMTRNRQLFARRNQKGINKLIAFFYFYLATIPKSSIKYLIKTEFKLLFVFWQAILWNLLNAKKTKQTPNLVVQDERKTIINSFYNYDDELKNIIKS